MAAVDADNFLRKWIPYLFASGAALFHALILSGIYEFNMRSKI
jgi:hypothetical protein